MLIDLDVAEANIAKMAAFAERAGLRLRPHIKTHKSVAMARRQLAAGAAGLCVATVTEAAAMAAAGLSDLTLAYPVVGQRKLERLAEVCRSADVLLVADSAEVADGYHGLARQVMMATVQVAQAGTPAQVQQASKILADTRKALYRILAADDEEAAGDSPG